MLRTPAASFSAFESTISGFLKYLDEFSENSVKPALDVLDGLRQLRDEYHIEIGGQALDAALADRRRQLLDSYVELLESVLSDAQSRTQRLTEDEQAVEKPYRGRAVSVSNETSPPWSTVRLGGRQGGR